MDRITESQLVLPALYIISKTDNGFISTSNLIAELEKIMHPTGMDADILAGRNDTYFSQKVRNLKSHDTLCKPGYADNHADGFRITDLGRTMVANHVESLKYLFSDNFNYEDVKDAISSISAVKDRKALPVEEIVYEGRLISINAKRRVRSQKLRKIAVEHFTHNNTISCECCGFNFPEFYGKLYGKDCIEIHHKKPIFQYQDETFEQMVDNALQNLLPVCPNCHRVIHKNHIGSEDIATFMKNIRQRITM